jgi:hypothetical protein
MSVYGRYLKENFWKHLFDTTQAAITRPTSYKVHLHTAEPGDLGISDEVDTADWTNYAAITVNNNHSTSPYFETPWLDGEDWVTDNNGELDFGQAVMDAPDIVVAVTHASLKDQLGNCWMKGELANPLVIRDGTPVKFADGTFDLRIK